MNYDEAKLYLEHTSYADFNLDDHQIKNRLEAIKTILKENQQLRIQISAREELIKRYENNWNELREVIRKKQDYYRYVKDNRYRKFLSELLDKMQELQGSNNDE